MNEKFIFALLVFPSVFLSLACPAHVNDKKLHKHVPRAKKNAYVFSSAINNVLLDFTFWTMKQKVWMGKDENEKLSRKYGVPGMPFPLLQYL